MLCRVFLEKSLLDDFMSDFAFPYTGKRTYGKEAANLMRTDVKDTASAYEIEIELPGVKKENVKAELKNGVSDHHGFYCAAIRREAGRTEPTSAENVTREPAAEASM